jgi:hypothetical protein
LSVETLVAGFDRRLSPPGKIFRVSSEDRGAPTRCDIPAFAAIGSGAIVAEFMMFYRDVSLKLPVRAAVYYALEAKYFGEQASGVSGATDLFVLLFDGTTMVIIQIDDEKTIEKKLIPICEKLEPRDPENGDIEILNGLPELKGLPKLPLKRERMPRQKKEGGKK